MTKSGDTVRYTDKELDALGRKEGSRSDWRRAARMTDEEIEAAIADDPDEAGMEVDWSRVEANMPEAKAVLNMRVDRDVLDFFRNQGRGYQTRINAVLRAYMDAHTNR